LVVGTVVIIWTFWVGSVEMKLISFLVVLATMNGSAQIIFSWLPPGMAAHTPISVRIQRM
jgi:NADH:ubiquinone oxidoreductase subunit 5 (subunit L)/multisubunit Na+/H+ antiporter MnhA subunit